VFGVLQNCNLASQSALKSAPSGSVSVLKHVFMLEHEPTRQAMALAMPTRTKGEIVRVDGYGTQRGHHIAPVHPSLSSRGKVRRSQSASTVAGGWCGIPHGFDRGIGRSQAVHLRSGRRAATPYSYHSHPWVLAHGPWVKTLILIHISGLARLTARKFNYYVLEAARGPYCLLPWVG
jgi:hypothetical protein